MYIATLVLSELWLYIGDSLFSGDIPIIHDCDERGEFYGLFHWLND
jgi:hypothetical protein